MNVNKIAEYLDQAALKAQSVPQVSLTRKLTVDEAYAVQTILLSRRYRRGETMTGLKLGFTSKAKMEQMGVSDMIWGRLTDAMAFKDSGTLPLHEFIHPRAEPEIAFRFSKKVDKIIEASDIPDYVSGVCVAIEIIDSRYENFKFSLEDVIADNCSSAAYALGDWQPATTDVSGLAMSLSIDDEVVHEGNSNAILGDPVDALTAASRLALEYGEVIEPGHILLAGAATPAVFLKEGTRVKVSAERLGDVHLSVSSPT